MKKIHTGLITMFLVSIFATGAMANEPCPKIFVNGNQVELNNQQAIIQNERIYVPMRFFSDFLGARIDWPGRGNIILKRTNNLEYIFVFDNSRPTTPYSLSQRNEDTLVPLRQVCESLGAKVVWEAENVYISDKADKVN